MEAGIIQEKDLEPWLGEALKEQAREARLKRLKELCWCGSVD